MPEIGSLVPRIEVLWDSGGPKGSGMAENKTKESNERVVSFLNAIDDKRKRYSVK